MCVYWRFTVTHKQSEMLIDEKLLDLDLISIEDYSIRGRITNELYEKALE